MFSVLLAFALSFGANDASYARETAEAFVSSCTPRDAGTIRGSIAANWLLERASVEGINVRRDTFWAQTPRGRRRFVNLYSEFETNPSSRWVVVVSHFDTKPRVNCPGANDGGSTSALLIAMARAFRNQERPDGNLMFVWTDGEECMGDHYTANDGLQGSRRAVEYLKARGRKVQAVICVDMLGDKELKIVVPANGNAALAKIACHAARRIGEDGLVELSENLVKDDHVPFLEAGYPAIDLIDFEYGPRNSWWHTKEDTPDKLSEASLLKSGRLLAEMLNLLM